MRYKVIGLMSGSSLDGLDIAYVQLEAIRGKWSYTVEAAETLAYDAEWTGLLRAARGMSGVELMRLHSRYGHYLGTQVQEFILRHGLEHRVDLVASHGHTVFHEPAGRATCQIGDGAAIAAQTSLAVVSDLRALDMALGGQGAPIVPIGDRLLFGDYDAWLNLGGIANVTLRLPGDRFSAFDIAPCNQVLNALAGKVGLPYDAGGLLASKGVADGPLLEQLNRLPYYQLEAPKSLDNAFSGEELLPLIEAAGCSVEDALRTAVAHLTAQIAAVLPAGPADVPSRRTVLVTGGGALNTFLLETLTAGLTPAGWSVVVPDEQTVQFKEAIVMALIGALRWREEDNVFADVTGAQRSSIGGALWMGAPFAG